MYKPIDKSQHTFLNFDQPMGFHMNSEQEYIQNSETILPVAYYVCYHLYAKARCVCSFILHRNDKKGV